MFGLGPWEISLIVIVLFLLFGKRLPQIAGSLGKSVVSFKKGLAGLQEADPRPDVQKALNQEQPGVQTLK